MNRYELIAIKNRKGERKLIREEDFDEEKHELFDAPKKEPEKDEEPDKQYEHGDFKAQETDAKGWWEVINTETQERQHEKNLREEDAIALAKELSESESE